MAVRNLRDCHNYKNNNKGVNNMKNVKTLIIVALMGASLIASTTRTQALGGAGFWAEDYANIGAFPADVNNHSVAWTDGTDFTSIFNANGTTWGFAGGTDANDVVNMMWGNGSMGAAFGLNMLAAVECEDDDLGCVAADAETNFNIGFGMPLAGMDFGFTYDGDMMGVNLRRAQNVWLWDNMLINFDMTPENEDDGTASDMNFNTWFYSNTAYDGGTNGLFALGFAYGAEGCLGDDCEAPDGTLNMVWNFAVESAMTDWATLRVNYMKAYDWMGGDNAPGMVNMGLGFNYGSFTLDMMLNSFDSMMNDPVKYVTGRNTAALGSEWTISYAW